jgi:hypothetical protein
MFLIQFPYPITMNRFTVTLQLHLFGGSERYADVSELRTQGSNTTCLAFLACYLLSMRLPVLESSRHPIGERTTRVGR